MLGKYTPVLARGRSTTQSRTLRHVGFTLLLASCCLTLGRTALSKDIILGRIDVKVNEDDGSHVGPLRLTTDVETVFQEFLRSEQLSAEDVTSDRLSEMLAGHSLVLLKDGDAAASSPAQWEPMSPRAQSSSTRGHLVWFVDAARERPVDGEYTLVLREVKGDETAFDVQDIDDRSLRVSYGDRPVLQYNYGIVRQRPGQTGPYDRACYLHPVWTPSGKVVTGDFSPEHIHQRGVYLAWRRTRFGEQEVDFWGLGDSPGRVLPSGTPPKIITGPVFTKLIFSNQGMIDDTVAFDEIVEVTLYAGEISDGWLFDVRVQQTPRTEVPMELPKIYYGGMSFRGPSVWLSKDSADVQRALSRGVTFEDIEWLPEDTKLDVLTSEGDGRTGGDRTRARWIDYTGPLNGDWGGLALYDHRSSPRYPTPLRVHPGLPYFSVAFVQQKPYTIQPDQTLDLVYRIHPHDGHPDSEFDERVTRSFNGDPEMTWNAP